MTTSDLVARLTARANLTYSYPIEDILLLRGAANEIERLREALEDIASGRYSGVLLTSFPPKDPAVERARAALAGQKSTQEK